MRKAYIKSVRSRAEVERYLPENYRVTGELPAENGRVSVFIEGEDRAGWTLDDYVIPRLASGLIWAEEES